MEPEKDCLNVENVKRIWQKTIDEAQAGERRIGKKRIVAKFCDTYLSLHPDSSVDIYSSNGLTRIQNPEVQPGDIVHTRTPAGQVYTTLGGPGARIFSVLNGVNGPLSDPNADSGMVVAGFCCATCQRIVAYPGNQQKSMSNADMGRYNIGKYQRTNPTTGKGYVCESCDSLSDIPQGRFGKTSAFDAMAAAFTVHKQKITAESNTQEQTDFKN